MARGKNIEIFIKSGIAKCQIRNWSGVVYIIPRTLIDVGKKNDRLNISGIYLLLGTTDKDEELSILVKLRSVKMKKVFCIEF